MYLRIGIFLLDYTRDRTRIYDRTPVYEYSASNSASRPPAGRSWAAVLVRSFARGVPVVPPVAGPGSAPSCSQTFVMLKCSPATHFYY